MTRKTNLQKFIHHPLIAFCGHTIALLMLFIVISLPQLAIIASKKHPLQTGIAFYLLYILIVIGLVKLKKHLNPTTAYHRLSHYDKRAIGFGILAMYGFQIAFNTLRRAMEDSTQTVNNQVIKQLFSYSHVSALLMVSMVVIFAPICEELLFRGILSDWIFPKHPHLQLLISAAAFSCAHISADLSSWLLYAGLGVILMYSYQHTKNLLVDTGIHFLNNALPGIVMFFMVYQH